MIVVDTNILVRYAVKDDRSQTIAATDFLRVNRCLVLKTVLLECAWVLASAKGYGLAREVVHERLLHILGLPNVEMENAGEVARALDWYAGGLDFADALHLAGSSQHYGLVTFDRKFAELAAGHKNAPIVRLLAVGIEE